MTRHTYDDLVALIAAGWDLILDFYRFLYEQTIGRYLPYTPLRCTVFAFALDALLILSLIATKGR